MKPLSLCVTPVAFAFQHIDRSNRYRSLFLISGLKCSGPSPIKLTSLSLVKHLVPLRPQSKPTQLLVHSRSRTDIRHLQLGMPKVQPANPEGKRPCKVIGRQAVLEPVCALHWPASRDKSGTDPTLSHPQMRPRFTAKDVSFRFVGERDGRRFFCRSACTNGSR